MLEYNIFRFIPGKPGEPGDPGDPKIKMKSFSNKIMCWLNLEEL